MLSNLSMLSNVANVANVDSMAKLNHFALPSSTERKVGDLHRPGRGTQLKVALEGR